METDDPPVGLQSNEPYSDNMNPDLYPDRSGLHSEPTILGAEAYSAMDVRASDDCEQQVYGDEQPYQSPERDIDEMSPCEYAEYHGLITNHLQKNPFQEVEYPLIPQMELAALEDPESGPGLDKLLSEDDLLKLNASERLDIDKDAVAFLLSLLDLAKGDEGSKRFLRTTPLSYLRDLKLEEPVLASDPELDLWRLRKRNTNIISSSGMEPFHLDREKGEGLAWSKEEKNAHVQIEKLMTNEKLDIDINTLTYLKDEILGLDKPPTREDITSACLDDRPDCQPQPESPPLLPLSPPLSPRVPLHGAMEMALTSSPADLIAQEAASMEQQILREEEPSSSCSTSNQTPSFDTTMDPKRLYSPLCTPQDSSSSPWRRTRIRNLEVEVPLIPVAPNSTPPTKNKTVSFPSVVHTMIQPSDPDLRTCDSEQGLDFFITEVVTPLAESALQEAKNERLSQFDTTMRVSVPDIEQIEPKMPWKRPQDGSRSIDLHHKLQHVMESSLFDTDKKWSGVSKVERLLSWSPFPTRLGKVQIDETFDDGSLARYMTEITLEDRVNLEELVWKPEGLRILDNADSDDDDIECLEADEFDGTYPKNETRISNEDRPTHAGQELDVIASPTIVGSQKTGSQPMDMQTLLKKRKLELECKQDRAWPNKQSDRDISNGKGLTSGMKSSELARDVDGMSVFLRLHGNDVKITDEPSRRRGPTLQQFAPPAVMVQPETGPKEDVPATPPPAPAIVNSELRKATILSSDFSRNRSLVRLILKALPEVEIMEREAITSPDTNARTTTKHFNKYEADLTLSPSTGAIVTTLQQLKQKPLPGQSNYFGVRDRIQTVAVRYEQIHVLVNEARPRLDGDQTVTGALDRTDAEALSDLIGFGAVLDADIEVHYIAGGEAELAQWVAALISRYSVSDISLLQEETVWERFLRYAGLNSFASQAVLGRLKRVESSQAELSPSSVGGSTMPAYGLAAFIQMPAEKRLEQFGPLMGGDRVLRRVNDAIDSHWMSVANEKRR